MTRRLVRPARLLGVGVLATALILGSTSLGSAEPVEPEVAAAEPEPAASEPVPDGAEDAPVEEEPAPAAEDDTDNGQRPTITARASATSGPYGNGYPVQMESTFGRPADANTNSGADFYLLNEMERLIRGSYWDLKTNKLRSDRKNNSVYLSISRMDDSKRVGRELIKAAAAGVQVHVIHGESTQFAAWFSLKKSLSKYRNAKVKICAKGKSMACLSSLPGAIMHSKILLVSSTYTRNGDLTKGAVWTGSANLGGDSGEKTYNNGWVVHNDKLMYTQMRRLWDDMWAERNVGNDYLNYVARNPGKYSYGEAAGKADGYDNPTGSRGMFYSQLSNTTIYETPIKATPTNGKDPVMNALNRIVPGADCTIRLQHNRFKYRRIGVAQKLVELSNKGCDVSAIAYEDNSEVNRVAHCQSYIRICRPILDVFRTSNEHIDVAYAKPHDKTLLIDAKMLPNKLNGWERLPNGDTWPAAGAHVKMVQAGSASLTGSNLVVSDEVTTETTDPKLYADYLGHWDAIWKSKEHRDWRY